jgi:hypothetical protein
MAHCSSTCVQKTILEITEICTGANSGNMGVIVHGEFLKVFHINDDMTVNASETYNP